MLPIANTAAGASGSPFRAVLSFTAKGTGTYVLNDTNFPGLGRYLPGFVLVTSGTPANVGLQVSTDGGTTWKVLYGSGTPAAPSNGGGMVFADAGGSTGVGAGVSTSASVRLVIVTGATDVFMFPLGAD